MMMSRAYERREYNRVSVSLKAVAFIPGVNDDVPCHIVDIGEKGLCFDIPVKYGKFIEKGTEIGFHFSDTIQFGYRQETYVVTGTGEVKHIEEKFSGIYVGCKTSSRELRKYAMKRDAMTYIMARANRRKRNKEVSVQDN